MLPGLNTNLNKCKNKTFKVEHSTCTRKIRERTSSQDNSFVEMMPNLPLRNICRQSAFALKRLSVRALIHVHTAEWKQWAPKRKEVWTRLHYSTRLNVRDIWQTHADHTHTHTHTHTHKHWKIQRCRGSWQSPRFGVKPLGHRCQQPSSTATQIICLSLNDLSVQPGFIVNQNKRAYLPL